MKTRAASTVANDCTLDGTSIVAEGCAEARTAVDGCVISSSVVQRYSSGSALEDSCTVGGCLLEGSAAASSGAVPYVARRMLATDRAACRTVKESDVEDSASEGGATVDIREGRGEEAAVGEVVALRDECDSSRSRKCFIQARPKAPQQGSVKLGTVLLLQELLFHQEHIQSSTSFIQNTGLLLSAIPLYGAASCQPSGVRRKILRSWHWRSFIFSQNTADDEFRKTFRMPRGAFWKLLDIVEPDLIRKQTNCCTPLSPAIRLCVFLYYAGHGSSLQQISDQFGIGRSTASGIIKCVSDAIVSRMANWISFPEARAELLRLSREFEHSHRLPGCVAAIDGCHIPITQPAVPKSHKFYNRKGFYSLNMSAAVDNKRSFLDVDIRWPGSVGDSRVFNNSELGRRHGEILRAAGEEKGAGAMQVGWYTCERVPFYLLADSAYANSTHVVTTYEIAEAQADVVVARLNQKLAGMRYTVECAFGILKGRWRLLGQPIEMARNNLDSVPTVIMSLCILHNFLIEYGDTVWDPKEERKRKAYYEANYLSMNCQGDGTAKAPTGTTRDGLLRWMRFFDSVRSAS